MRYALISLLALAIMLGITLGMVVFHFASENVALRQEAAEARLNKAAFNILLEGDYCRASGTVAYHIP